MNAYQRFVRPLLFRCDPERIHEQTLALAERVGSFALGRHLLASLFAFADSRLATQVGGLHFANPLGMAAGFDKNGRVIQALDAMGFGFVEVGSVSAHPSAGNPRPRLFRLPLDEAIVVNYGVPNDGAAVVADRVAQRPIAVPLGINLVETNTGQAIEPDAVVAELAAALVPFVGRASYIAFNLNCPNTTGGVSPFTSGEHLRDLLRECAAIDDLPPIFLKLTAHTDPARLSWMLEAVDPFAFVKGFIFNLPPGTNYPLKSPAHPCRSATRNLVRPARSSPDRRNRALLVRAHRPPAARDHRRGGDFIGPRRLPQNPPRGFAGAAILSTGFQGAGSRAANQRGTSAPVGARWICPGGRRGRHRQPSKSSGVAIPTECGG